MIGLLTWPLAPAAAAYAALHPRLRRDLRGRLGLEVPPVQPGAVWVHASSVGEVAAADALLDRWSGPAVLTTDSDTGWRSARFSPAAVAPIDHPVFLAPLWAEARPRAVVFVEDALWPHLALRARADGVPVLRVSGRAGPGARRGALLHRLCAPDAVSARDEAARRWFASVHPGVPVSIGGDLKAARTAPPPLLRWARPFVVGASTRDGDEERLLAAVDAIDPTLGVLLAPRHLERIDTFRFPFVRRTDLPTDEVPHDARVVVLDTLGELRAGVVGAAAAYVGGTFDARIGGHTPFEAHAAGVPVCAGPHVGAQGDAFTAVGAHVGPDLEVTLRAALAPGRAARSPVDDPARAAADFVAAWLGAPAAERSPRPWAWPLAPLLRARWPRRAERLPAPVVSVGSANARGPGRTSTVRAVVALLAGHGHTVGVAVSGYRRTRGGEDVRLGTDPADVGDEGALLAATGALVAAGRDRRRAARLLVEAGATVVVLDDGLRHTELVHDLDIVVVDARFPSARGALPAGERRASPSPRDAVVVVHHGGGLFDVPGLPAGRAPDPWVPRRPDGPVAAFAGIARPADFLATLDVPVARFLALPDHAPLDEDELRRFAGELPLVCTAKDATRLPVSMQQAVAWRDVSVRIPPALVARILDVVSTDMHANGTGFAL